MWNIARNLARHNRYGRLLAGFLVVASLLWTFAVLAVTAQLSLYDAAAGRAEQYRLVSADHPDEAEYFYEIQRRGFSDGTGALAITLVPRSADVTPPSFLPPDLPFGSIVASSAWLESPEAQQGWEFAEWRKGLTDVVGWPDEQLAIYWADPAGALTEAMSPIAGFDGGPGMDLSGSFEYSHPAREVATFAAAMLLPGLLAFVSALRVGSGNRAHRVEVLQQLGFSRARVTGLQLLEFVPAVLGGTVLAVLAFVPFFAVPHVSLPAFNTVTSAADLRAHWPWFVGALLFALVISCALVASPLGLRRERADTVVPRHVRIPKALVWQAIAVVLWGGLGTLTINAVKGSDLIMATPFVLILVIAGFVVLLPLSLRAVLRLIAMRQIARGRQAGELGPLLAGAQAWTRPRPTVRFAARTALICLIFLISAVTSNEVRSDVAANQAPPDEGVARFAYSDTAVGQARNSGATSELVHNAARVLGEQVVFVNRSDDGSVDITGDMTSLAGLGLQPGTVGSEDLPPSVARVARYAENVRVESSAQIPTSASDYLVLTDDPHALRAKVQAALVPAPELVDQTNPGGAGLNREARAYQGFAAVVGVGVVLLSVAVLFGFASELIRLRRALLVVNVMADGWRRIWAVVWRRMTIPVLIGAGLGIAVGFLLALGAQNTLRPIADLPWAAGIGAALMAVVIALGASAIITVSVCRNQRPVVFAASDEA